MIGSFDNKLAFNVFTFGVSKKLDGRNLKRALHLLDIMDSVESLQELKQMGFPPSVRLHMLKGDRKGTWAIDVFKVSGWRITFVFKAGFFENVKIENYHKG